MQAGRRDCHITHYAQWRGKKEIEHDLPVGHGEDTNSTAFSPFVFTPLEPLPFQKSHLSLCFFPHWLYDPKTMLQTGTQFPFCNPSLLPPRFHLVPSCPFSIKILLHHTPTSQQPHTCPSHLPWAELALLQCTSRVPDTTPSWPLGYCLSLSTSEVSKRY